MNGHDGHRQQLASNEPSTQPETIEKSNESKPVDQEVEDFDEYFKESIESRTKDELKLKNLSRKNSENVNNDASTSTSDSTTGSSSASPAILIKISDEDLENLKLDSKLKKYEASLRRSPNSGGDTEKTEPSGDEPASPLSSQTSRPQFRVPFFFK